MQPDTAKEPLTTRTCPVCRLLFQPRRIDQFFDNRDCRDARYSDEYEALFYQFPKVLISQNFRCHFFVDHECNAEAPAVKLVPLLIAHNTWVATCRDCKRRFYVSQ